MIGCDNRIQLSSPSNGEHWQHWHQRPSVVGTSKWNIVGNSYPESSEQTSQADMLGVLGDLGDALLLEEFIQKTIASHLEEADIPYLICAMRLLDKKNFTQVITEVHFAAPWSRPIRGFGSMCPSFY